MSIEEAKKFMSEGTHEIKQKACFWCAKNEAGEEIPLEYAEITTYALCKHCISAKGDHLAEGNVHVISCNLEPLFPGQLAVSLEEDLTVYPEGQSMFVSEGFAERVIKAALIESYNIPEGAFIKDGAYFIPKKLYMALLFVAEAKQRGKSPREIILGSILETILKDNE